MSRLVAASDSPAPWTGKAYTVDQVLERLNYWREHLLELGSATTVITRREVEGAIDRWLDELLDIRGR